MINITKYLVLRIIEELVISILLELQYQQHLECIEELEFEDINLTKSDFYNSNIEDYLDEE